MRLRLVPKEGIPPDQLMKLDARVRQSIEQEGDCGPPKAWLTYQRYLYAFALVDGGEFIAIAEASGRPMSGPGWWIDSEYRGLGYGNDLVDLLAQHLRHDGVTGIIRPIPIQTPNGLFDEQSRKLVRRLRKHFE